VPIRAVWFDVGEALIDESREYGTWADWLGIPRHTFSAVFGAVIARGDDYRQVFQHFRSGFDLEKERRARLDAGLGEYLNANDLYADVRPCFESLRESGYFIGVAGNQTARAGRFIRELNLQPMSLPPLMTGVSASLRSPSFTGWQRSPGTVLGRSFTWATASTMTSHQRPRRASGPYGSDGDHGDTFCSRTTYRWLRPFSLIPLRLSQRHSPWQKRHAETGLGASTTRTRNPVMSRF